MQKKSETMQSWEKTKVQCLVRNAHSGIYYARARVSGKLVWKSLKTDLFAVAKARLQKALADTRKNSLARVALEGGYATFGEAAKIYLSNVARKVDLKPRSVDYQREVVQALLKSWPELGPAKMNAISSRKCLEWASGYAVNLSPGRYNSTVDALRKIFDLGIAGGLIASNPAAALAKKTHREKTLELPTKTEFAALVAEMRSAGGWCSEQVGDLVEFLAYSGTRIGEARNVKWEDVDSDRGVIWIHGDPITGTKNSQRRQVPIIEPMARLLKNMRESPGTFRDPDRQRLGYILAIRECQKAIDRACSKLAIKRITHHDLRHLFATASIESGVDIAIVSRWLGHKDGGALAMKTYGHLRDEHSQAMAAKVIF